MTLGIALGAAACWFFAFKQSCPTYRLYPGTDPPRQLAAVVGDPLAFLATAVSFYARWAPRLSVQFVGRLGWLDTPLPRSLVAVMGLLLVLVAATSADAAAKLRARHRALLIGTAAVSLLWTSVLLYVVVSPLGSGEIGGTQGRYLIPLAAPFFLSWAGIARPIDWDRRAGWIVGIAVAASAGALFVVWRRYYV